MCITILKISLNFTFLALVMLELKSYCYFNKKYCYKELHLAIKLATPDILVFNNDASILFFIIKQNY